MNSQRWRMAGSTLLVVAALVIPGCATTGASAGQRLDPWENWNRKVFSFNETLDKNILKPVATAYKDVVPELIRTGVGNVFSNIADAWSAVNNVLQGKFEAGLNDTVRFTTNTLFGFGGILDIASEIGLEHQYEDFGQTLGRWGVGAGAYIVWPVLGPSTVRETVAMPLDRLATPAVVFNGFASQAAITVLQLVNTRANLLGAGRILDDIAWDRYSFIRDAYLARRRSLVYDGDPPDAKPPGGPGASDSPSGTPPPASEQPERKLPLNPSPSDAPASAPTK
jgi:phospholipid-binding lipoprotein MlaA